VVGRYGTSLFQRKVVARPSGARRRHSAPGACPWCAPLWGANRIGTPRPDGAVHPARPQARRSRALQRAAGRRISVARPSGARRRHSVPGCASLRGAAAAQRTWVRVPPGRRWAGRTWVRVPSRRGRAGRTWVRVPRGRRWAGRRAHLGARPSGAQGGQGEPGCGVRVPRGRR